MSFASAVKHLRRIDEWTQATRLDVEELKSLTSILLSDVAKVARQNDSFRSLFSRLTDRLNRIERRLQLRDG